MGLQTICVYRMLALMKNPAQRIIEKCGGPQIVAEMAEVTVGRVYRWTKPVEQGGTGGFVPTKRQHRILESAMERGIPLKPDDFFSGFIE